MALNMIRPTKHPKTGVYRLRGRLTAEMAAIYGKKEFKVSLGTKDAAEARHRAPEVYAALQSQWRQDSLAHALSHAETTRLDPIDLTGLQIHALAGAIYEKYVEPYKDDAGAGSDWQKQIDLDQKVATTPGFPGYRMAQLRWRPAVIKYLSEQNISVSNTSLLQLTSAVHRHLSVAHKTLLKKSRGDYSEDTYTATFPKYISSPEMRTLDSIFEGYGKTLAPSTHKRFKSVIQRFLVEQVGRDDFAAIKQDALIAWKDKLLAEGLAARTVRDVHLAAIKAACNWAVDNKRISDNPAIGVKIKVNKKGRKRLQRGYALKEAMIVLTAAYAVVDEGVLPPDRYAARRWIPWICAYTGARVNEITQMRAEDIVQETDERTSENVWMFLITPEAGSTKDKNARSVAIHDHLIEQGFLKFIKKVGRGPLFYDPGDVTP